MDRLETAFKIVDKTPDGGRIIITTPALDRDKDRVFPGGANVTDYLKNPVVLWGHNRQDPWAIIGKTTALTINEGSITADFELRPAASDTDPQHIIRALWENGFVRSASIGFRPEIDTVKANGMGGMDIPSWSLLEWSLIPIPANQEAMRAVTKSMTPTDEEHSQGEPVHSPKPGDHQQAAGPVIDPEAPPAPASPAPSASPTAPPPAPDEPEPAPAQDQPQEEAPLQIDDRVIQAIQNFIATVEPLLV
jgi:hypothetical protein